MKVVRARLSTLADVEVTQGLRRLVRTGEVSLTARPTRSRISPASISTVTPISIF